MGILKDMLQSGASPNYRSKNGQSALMAIAYSKHYRSRHALEKAVFLLKKGAKPDLANSSGETALMLAAGRGNLDLVKLFIDHGASIRLKNIAGETVYSYAERSGNPNLTRYLRSKGAKPGTGTNNKRIAVRALFGTWQGKQDGLPQAIFTLVLYGNNRFDFVSRYAPYYIKKFQRQYPNQQVRTVIAAQKGMYTVSNNHLTLMVQGHAPLSRTWKLANGILILDNKIRLRRIR